MPSKEFWQMWNDVQACEGGRGTDAQPTRKTGPSATRSMLSLVGFLDGALGPLVEAFSGFGWGEATGGAKQQLGAKPFLKLRD
jgi:hypothetical protein